MALSPKRVKYRKIQRGRVKGNATRCNHIDFGDFALVSLEPFWLTNRQLEAARVALNRKVKRVSCGYAYFPISRIRKSRLKHAWVKVRALRNIGWQLYDPERYCLSLPVLIARSRKKQCVWQEANFRLRHALPSSRVITKMEFSE